MCREWLDRCEIAEQILKNPNKKAVGNLQLCRLGLCGLVSRTHMFGLRSVFSFTTRHNNNFNRAPSISIRRKIHHSEQNSAASIPKMLDTARDEPQQENFTHLSMCTLSTKRMSLESDDGHALSRTSTVEAQSCRRVSDDVSDTSYTFAFPPVQKGIDRRSSCETPLQANRWAKDGRRTSAVMLQDLHRCISFPNIENLSRSFKSCRNVDEGRINQGKVSLASMDFDTARFSDEELRELVLEIFLQLRLEEHLGITLPKLRLFIERVRQHMFDNPYHNWTHVVDVVQAAYTLGLKSGLLSRLEPLQQFALLVSALCHDLEHPGVNNMSLVRSQPALSGLYGDSSSLEKHHSLRAFSLMMHDEVDLLGALDTATYYTFRDMVTRIIMATDMSRHRDFCARMEAGAPRDAVEEMELLIKCADTSNVLRPMHVAKHWAVRIGDEFFAQGDLERSMGLSVTPSCDRRSQTLVGLQKGFLDFCIGPFFEAIARQYPGLAAIMQQAQANRAAWDGYDDKTLYSELGRAQG